jgi:hypothetical protein
MGLASPSSAPGAPLTYRANVDAIFNMSSLKDDTQHLLIAFLDPIAQGNDFDRLTFAISGYYESFGFIRFIDIDHDFRSVAEALDFFGDNT